MVPLKIKRYQQLLSHHNAIKSLFYEVKTAKIETKETKVEFRPGPTLLFGLSTIHFTTITCGPLKLTFQSAVSYKRKENSNRFFFIYRYKILFHFVFFFVIQKINMAGFLYIR